MIKAVVHGLEEVSRTVLRKKEWNLLDPLVEAGTLFHQEEHVIDGRAQKSQIRETQPFVGYFPSYFDIHEVVLAQVGCYLARKG